MLTHGHEDHIGAVPYLLRERGDIPLVGSQLTLALLGSKLREHRLKETVHHDGPGGRPDQLRAVRPRVRRGQPLDPRRARGRDPHRRRHGAAHRRLQDGPAAARRPDHRPARVRPARRGGRRPLPDRLHQRRGARLHHLREGHRPGPRPGLPPAASSGSSWPASPRTCTASSRCSTPPSRTAARSRTSAARWSATWRSPATSATSTCPPGVLVDAKELADLPPERQVLISTGSQGEPLSRADAGSPSATTTSCTSRRATPSSSPQLADPRQRERRLPGHQRPGPAGAPTSCTRATRSCTSRGHASAGELLYCYNIVKPRNVLPVHGEIRHMRANAELAARHRRARRERVVIAEDGVVVDLVDGVAADRRQGRLRLRLRRRLLGRRHHRDRPQGPPDPRRGGLHLGDRGRSTRSPARWSAARRSTPAASPRTTRSSTRSSSRSSTRSTRRVAEGVDDTYQLQQTDPPRRRPLGQQHPPPPADDHPGRHRGLGSRAAERVARDGHDVPAAFIVILPASRRSRRRAVGAAQRAAQAVLRDPRDVVAVLVDPDQHAVDLLPVAPGVRRQAPGRRA